MGSSGAFSAFKWKFVREALMKMNYGGGKKSSTSTPSEMSNVKKSSGKTVTAGKGTIKTPFSRAIVRNVSGRK